MPAIRDFHARLAFAENELRIERFNGEIGGGKINASGRRRFRQTHRAHARPRRHGRRRARRARRQPHRARQRRRENHRPAGAARRVTGYVGITKSRYLKDIDIVPHQHARQARARAARAASGHRAEAGSIGVNVAPINKWKLDLAIKTDDPFFVRGNLANGQALVDLHVRGTGAAAAARRQRGNQGPRRPRCPSAAGNRRRATSRSPPTSRSTRCWTCTGTSTIRNYLVTVYVTGRAKDPKVTFSSDPPLAQEQIVSLLATGSTPDELAGNAQALAGKATLLVLQDLYRRTFPKKQSARDGAEVHAGRPGEPRRGRRRTRPRASSRSARRFKLTDRCSSWPTWASRATCAGGCNISSVSADDAKLFI